MKKVDYKYLYDVDSPADLKRLSVSELRVYADELRDYIVEQLSRNPGHLASSLGTVELATAIHYVYHTPHDKVVWDVGHQAYAHKIITGRRDRFETNRKLGGLSGFPKMSESEYDAFGGGHTSVSISAALGLATAAKLRGEKLDVVAVIGDGAMTGGLAFEGLNNAGCAGQDLLVILNDNNMSIDPNVGALKEYLLKITTSAHYNKLKTKVWNSLSSAPRLRRLLQNTGNALKQGFLQKSNLFESFNFRYFGPIDGHDIQQLTRVLSDLRDIPGPKLLHVLTVKGKGYEPAEENQCVWHAPGKFIPETGERLVSSEKKPDRYQDVFGQTVLDLARRDPRIVGITPAMPTGCSLNIMMDQMPERCFDVGIAEGHAVTFSAGLAAGGIVPFCNIYSSFMQRAYDNVIHDVAIQNLGVVMCLDRGGLVGEDGATHHGAFDLAYFRCIPNLVVSSPRNEADLRNLMYTASVSGRPFVIRYPRGNGEGVAWRDEEFVQLPIGKGVVLKEGDDVAVLTLGPLGNVAAQAVADAEAQGVSVMHIDMRYLKPLDEELLHRVGREFARVITVEDGVVAGGFGSAVVQFLNDNRYRCEVRVLGLPDSFVEHGTPAQLHHLCGLDQENMLREIVGK